MDTATLTPAAPFPAVRTVEPTTDADLHAAVSALLADHLGATPDKLVINYRDHLMFVFDPRPLMRLLGGPWLKILEHIEERERAPKAARYGAGV